MSEKIKYIEEFCIKKLAGVKENAKSKD